MNDAERNGLSAMRDCWITGGTANGVAPPEWRNIVGMAETDECERMLLAIAGQAFDIGFRPAAPAGLIARALLPTLAMPTVPGRHRPLFRAALKYAPDALGKLRVVAVAGARGYVAHPLDWMPSASETNAPRVYTPWVDWQQATNTGIVAPEALTVENWDDFLPAARHNALADLRRSDPAGARALLEAKAASETAEVRLPLIDLLRIGLSADDAPYLQSLASDRSGKIKLLASNLLARIGLRTGSSDENIRELAEFFEQGRAGLLRRRTVYSAKNLKSVPQAVRRNQLLADVHFGDLANALGASEQEFIEGWQIGRDDNIDRLLAQTISDTGSDASASEYARRMIEAKNPADLQALYPRLGPQERRALVDMALTFARDRTHLVVETDINVSSYEAPALLGSDLYKDKRAIIARRKPEEWPVLDFNLLAYLATPAAAQAMIADLTSVGLGFADPALALLRLNAALSER